MIRKAGAAFALAFTALVVLAPAGPAAAGPGSGSGIAVSPPKVTPGQLRFVLSGVGLAEDGKLTAGNVAVAVDGEPLAVKVEDAAGTPRAEMPSRGVIVAVDTSSATAGTPLADAEVAAFEFVDTLPEDVAVGLVAYGDTAQLVQPLTYDRSEFRTAAGTLTAKGGSAVYDGVRQAVTAFGTGYAQRRVVLLAAGPDTRSTATAQEAAAALGKDGIALDVVGYGAGDPGTAVTGLATGSGGQVVAAAGGSKLTDALAGLAGRFPAPVVVTATVPAALSGHASTVEVTVAAGGEPVATTVPVTFALDPAASQLQTVTLRMLPTILLIGAMVVIGVAVALAAFATAYQLLGRSVLHQRLRDIDRFTGERPASAPVAKPEGSALLRTALAVSERAVQRQGRAGIELALERAGLALRPAEWLLVRGIVAVITAALLLLMLPWFVAVPVGLLLGWFLSGRYLKFQAGRRTRKFGDLLPEALQLVVGALRSGFSLLQAIDAVVREGPEPVAGEFGRAMAEIRLGGDLEDALERTAERNANRDLSWLVMAIRIQREVGGNLSEVLDTAVETMRERGRLTRHVRALSAEGRLSAYILIGMPIVLSGFLFMFRGEYLRPMYTTPVGIAMLLGAAVMLGIGAFVISRLIKVEV